MLEKHLRELAKENNVLCFQEVNATWRYWMVGLFADMGIVPVKGGPHVDGFCIFHDKSVTVAEVSSPCV